LPAAAVHPRKTRCFQPYVHGKRLASVEDMTALIATLPPSFADMTATGSPGGANADKSGSGFSFDDLLSVFHAPSGDSNSAFTVHDLLSIVNPLQHFPIVSTIYRAVTGDSIKPFERIAGDSLYGGLWGFVSSVANVAFQEATGKDFGDTAIALLEGKYGDETPAVASNAASPVATPATIAAGAVTPATFGSVAPQLIATARAPTVAVNRNMSDSILSRRATSAYQKSLALPTNVSADSIPIY
jgi:hypothetical protein